MDVPRGCGAEWTAGEFAASHDVYFGTSFADVITAGRPIRWMCCSARAEPVRAMIPPVCWPSGNLLLALSMRSTRRRNNTIFKGDVWSFTGFEPLAYPLANV